MIGTGDHDGFIVVVIVGHLARIDRCRADDLQQRLDDRRKHRLILQQDLLLLPAELGENVQGIVSHGLENGVVISQCHLKARGDDDLQVRSHHVGYFTIQQSLVEVQQIGGTLCFEIDEEVLHGLVGDGHEIDDGLREVLLVQFFDQIGQDDQRLFADEHRRASFEHRRDECERVRPVFDHESPTVGRQRGKETHA